MNQLTQEEQKRYADFCDKVEANMRLFGYSPSVRRLRESTSALARWHWLMVVGREFRCNAARGWKSYKRPAPLHIRCALVIALPIAPIFWMWSAVVAKPDSAADEPRH